MLLPALARAKELGRRIACTNNLRQLGVSLIMYTDDNNGVQPERTVGPRWPERLLPIYKDIRLLRCPDDPSVPDLPHTGSSGTNGFIGDASPRSYIINGWNDYFQEQLGSAFTLGAMTGLSMREIGIREPTETIVLGEKEHSSPHYYMDFLEPGPGGLGNDITELDQGRHSAPIKNSRGGGSNHAFADGSARFLRFGMAFRPLDLWAVTDKWRNTQLDF